MFNISAIDEYVNDEYYKIYESFCFSLGIYAGNQMLSRKLLIDCFERCDKLHNRYYLMGVITGRLCHLYKNKIRKTYVLTTGDSKYDI